MSLKRPGVSIVIRTYFAGEALYHTLLSLSKLNYPKDRMEIIIVKDPKDNVEEYVGKALNKRIKVRIISLEVNSATKAWNTGITISKNPIVVVMPDDVEVHPNIINYALEILETNKKVAAVTYPPITSKASIIDEIHGLRYVGTVTTANTILVVTFFRKNVLLEVGLYREDMGPPLSIHEDWELGSRLVRRGYLIIVDGRVPVKHLKPSRRGDSRECVDSSKGILGIAISYMRSYLGKHYWSFIQVFKVSPLNQLLEYICYLVLPPLVVVTGFLIQCYLVPVLIVVTTVVYVELNALIRGYYKSLSLGRRLAYPLMLTLVRLVRTWLSFMAFTYWKLRRSNQKRSPALTPNKVRNPNSRLWLLTS